VPVAFVLGRGLPFRFRFVDAHAARKPVSNQQRRLPQELRERKPLLGGGLRDRILLGVVEPQRYDVTSHRHLEWRNVDLRERVVTVRRAYSGGVLRDWGNTDRSRRRVPLRLKAVEALEALPRRLDTRLMFPALRGGHMNLHHFRARDWKPAIRAAGIEPERRIYDLRHSYATWSLAAGVSLFSLAAGGHERRDDRPHLRAPGAGRGELRAGATGRLRREKRGVWAAIGHRIASESNALQPEIPAKRRKPTPGLEPGTPSLRVKCSTS
jgi:integrase